MVQERLKHLKILESFHLKEIGTDIITTIDQANNFINKRKYNMIIHGTVFSGNADGRYRYDLNNLMFTYIIFNTPKDSRHLEALKRDFDLFAKQRDWLIEESNDIIDTQKVSNNLVEIILYIIAQCLSRNIDTIPFSIRIFETLLPEIERKAQKEGKIVNIDTTQNKITLYIENLRSGRLRNNLGTLLLLYSSILIESEDYNTAITQAEKGLRVGGDPIDAHASIAVANFYLGKMKESESHVDEMAKIDLNHPLYLVDKAFFHLRQKKNKKAVDLYRRLPDMHALYSHIIFEVVSFLSVQLKNHPSEIAYLFAMGFLNYHHGDKKEGLRMLSLFKNKSKNEAMYRVMYNVASNLS